MEPSHSSSFTQLLKGHVRLLRHEYTHEKDVASRRLRAIGVGVTLFVFGIFSLEVAAIVGFMAAGLPPWASALVVALINFGFGLGAIRWFGLRRADDGPPFEMSKMELSRTAEWMQKSFFSSSNGSAKK